MEYYRVTEDQTGKEIIDYLISQGAENNNVITGHSPAKFYYVNRRGNIGVANSTPPSSWTEAFVPKKEKELTFPRKMMVWDYDEEDEVIDIVYGIFTERSNPFSVVGKCSMWRNAKEIPVREMTLDVAIEELEKQLNCRIKIIKE